jgi:hypothetical protein
MTTSLNGVSGRAVVQLVLGSGLISSAQGVATYVSGTFNRQTDSWGVYTHQVKFLTYSAYRAADESLSKTRRLKFRSGLDSGGTVVWSPTQTQVVVGWTGDAASLGKTGAGFTLIIQCSDLLFAGALHWSTQAWRGSPGEIAAAVGTAIGLTPNVETSPGNPLTLLQCFQTYLSFLDRVTSDYLKGQIAADITYCAHGDGLMIGSAGWSGWPRYQLNYPGVGASSLEHLDTGNDRVQPGVKSFNSGSNMTTGLSYDPIKGTTKTFVIDPGEVTKFAGLALPSDPAAVFSHGRHAQESTAFTDTWWSRRFAESRLNQVGARVSVVGLDYILPGGVLNLTTVDQNDDFAGLYQIDTTYTEILGAEAKTRIILRRGQFNSAQNTAPGVPPENAGTTAVAGNKVNVQIQTN